MSWRKRKDNEKNDEFNFDSIFERFSSDFDSYFKDVLKEMNSFITDEDMENSPNVIRRTFGPYFYGRVSTIGPDGQPIVKEYGNLPNMTQPQISEPCCDQIPIPSEENLIDVFVEDKKVRIIAEIPGIEKDEIDIKATENKVILTTHSTEKNYSAEKNLSVKIKPKTAKANYKNGILEVIFEREDPEKEFEVQIE